VPDEAAHQSMVQMGMPKGYADAMIDLVKVLRGFGRIAPTTTVNELLGRGPGRFEAFATANAAAFR
jgi:hypothetical protein